MSEQSLHDVDNAQFASPASVLRFPQMSAKISVNSAGPHIVAKINTDTAQYNDEIWFDCNHFIILRFYFSFNIADSNTTPTFLYIIV